MNEWKRGRGRERENLGPKDAYLLRVIIDEGNHSFASIWMHLIFVIVVLIHTVVLN